MTKKDNEAAKYEKLGRMLVELNDYGVSPSRKFYATSFIRGVVSGFGGVVGATIVVALLLWILSLFGQVPFLAHFVDKVRDTLSTTN